MNDRLRRSLCDLCPVVSLGNKLWFTRGNRYSRKSQVAYRQPHAGCALGPQSPLLCSRDARAALSASDGVRD